MTFRHRLQYLLVKKLTISNKKALDLIEKGEIFLNEKVCTNNAEIEETDKIDWLNTNLQIPKEYLYFAFYKPMGIETTLNENIAYNLKTILPQNLSVFPVGRLDKASEGLLLLTNNGKVFDKILRAENHIEKEYQVTVNKTITAEFIDKMANGVSILGKITKPCKINKLNDIEFNIILTQGLNRQIRRMCYKLDYEVTKLKRIRIGPIILGDLLPGEYKIIVSNDFTLF